MDWVYTARSQDDVWAQRNYRGRSEDALRNHAPVDHGVGTVLACTATPWEKLDFGDDARRKFVPAQ